MVRKIWEGYLETKKYIETFMKANFTLWAYGDAKIYKFGTDVDPLTQNSSFGEATVSF